MSFADKFSDKNEQAEETYVSIISTVAVSAAMQVKGVASVSFDAGEVAKPSKKKKKNSAVEVELYKDKTALIDITVNIRYGFVIPEVVAQMQEKIKNEVEKATFYKVKAINVVVAGVVYAE